MNSRDDSNNSTSPKLARRTFLQSSAILGASTLSLPAIEDLTQLIAKSFIQKAQAESLSPVENPRNYINILLMGAPLRYSFDHWIATNPGETLLDKKLANKMVATALDLTGNQPGGSGISTKYETFNYRGLQVPRMFSQSVYNGAGSLRPLTDLLDSMMVIRGYGTGLDGHPTNVVRQYLPVGGASSLSGLAADASVRTFQALQWPDRGDFTGYFSKTGKAMNKLGSTGNPLNRLLEGFAPMPENQRLASALIDRNLAAIDQARARLQAYANSDLPGAQSVGQNMANATTLMKKGISQIDGYWAEALPRYQRVILDSIRRTDLANWGTNTLMPNGSGYFNLRANGVAVKPTSDLLAAVASWSLPNGIAEGFALAEYAIKQGLATSIELSPMFAMGSINLMVDQTMKSFILENDMHDSGAVTALVLTTSFFRGLSAAILELRDQLKATSVGGVDLWSETVVQIMSDFGRSARSDGMGSDHGYNQMITSVFGGIIPGPLVVGNSLYSHSKTADNYGGSQGVGAPIDGYTQKGMPTTAMPASTVAELLRVPQNPYKNTAAPLAQVKNGVVVPLNRGKLVSE